MQTLEDTLDSSRQSPASRIIAFRIGNLEIIVCSISQTVLEAWQLHWLVCLQVGDTLTQWHWGYQDISNTRVTHHSWPQEIQCWLFPCMGPFLWAKNNILTCVTLNVEMITGHCLECGAIFSCGSDPLLDVTIRVRVVSMVRSACSYCDPRYCEVSREWEGSSQRAGY